MTKFDAYFSDIFEILGKLPRRGGGGGGGGGRERVYMLKARGCPSEILNIRSPI